MGQAFTPVEQELMRRLIAAERAIATMQRASMGQPLMTVKSNAPLVLTGTDSVVPGSSIAIVKPGRYYAIASADISISVASAGNLVHVSIQAVGGVQTFDLHGFYPMDVAGRFGTCVALAAFNFTTSGNIAIYGRRTAGTSSIESANGATGLMVLRAAPV